MELKVVDEESIGSDKHKTSPSSPVVNVDKTNTLFVATHAKAQRLNSNGSIIPGTPGTARSATGGTTPSGIDTSVTPGCSSPNYIKFQLQQGLVRDVVEVDISQVSTMTDLKNLALQFMDVKVCPVYVNLA